MLSNIDIENIAVIEKISFSLSEGMSVLTGETGAGKSVLIDSVNMVLGARANKALVRYGTDRARVQAMFTSNEKIHNILSENGIESEDEIVITRELTSDGKSIARINGTMIPIILLKDISHLLINIHGQHDNQSLLNPSKHIVFLDAFSRNQELLKEYTKCYSQLKALEKELSELNKSEQDRLSRIDLLKYQTDELSRAKLQKGEEEALKEEFGIISNFEKISESTKNAFLCLYDGDFNAYEAINKAITQLSSIENYDSAIGNMCERLRDAVYTVEDAAHELREYIDKNEFDAERLEVISSRLDLIKKLQRKYGKTVDECIEFYEKAQKELDTLMNFDEKSSCLLREVQEKKKELKKLSDKLSISRKSGAKKLSQYIQEEIRELDMEKAQFCVSVEKCDEFMPDGTDCVEFLFSANPGQPPAQLSQIASGGELSRVMLAMKTVLAEVDDVEALIFDEIDTGVSGDAAQKIAKKLSMLGQKKQVICISHQPQLAAAADYNFKVEKKTENNSTKTTVRLLDDEERVAEIARITDGSNITKTSMQHAEEMIKNAKEHK